MKVIFELDLSEVTPRHAGDILSRIEDELVHIAGMHFCNVLELTDDTGRLIRKVVYE